MKKAEQIKNQLESLSSNDTFQIRYYAKKYGKIIDRKGTWTKPNTDVKGKHQVIKGNDVFFFWDLNAAPNATGNKWRQASNPLNLMVDKAQKWLFNTIGESEVE